MQGKSLPKENLTSGETTNKLSGKAIMKFLTMNKGYNFKALVLKPMVTMAPNIDMHRTIPITIQIEIASMILIGLVCESGLIILSASGLASLPTIKISNKSATIKPNQNSFKRFLKNWL